MEKFHFVQFVAVFGTVSCLAIGYYWKEIAQHRSALPWRVSLCIAAVVALIFTDMYLIEPYWLTVERVQIRSKELAEVLQGKTVVQISDLHLSSIGRRERKLIEELNSLRPDLLFITGDLLTEKKGEQAENGFRSLLEFAGQIKMAKSVYAIPGNYDGYFGWDQKKKDQLATAGVHVLLNESRKVLTGEGKAVWVAGSTYTSGNSYSEAYFQRAVSSIPAGAPVIMLNHYPDVFGRAHEQGIRLVLAGHTHGGQIGIPLLVRMSNSANKSQFMSGLYDTGTTKMYINRGIGTTGIPVRLFCRPEITILEFVH